MKKKEVRVYNNIIIYVVFQEDRNYIYIWKFNIIKIKLHFLKLYTVNSHWKTGSKVFAFVYCLTDDTSRGDEVKKNTTEFAYTFKIIICFDEISFKFFEKTLNTCRCYILLYIYILYYYDSVCILLDKKKERKYRIIPSKR